MFSFLLFSYPLLRSFMIPSPVIEKNLLQRKPVLLIHGEKKIRQHHNDHCEHTDCFIACLLQEEISWQTDQRPDRKANNLPECQVENYLCFYLFEISLNLYLCFQ